MSSFPLNLPQNCEKQIIEFFVVVFFLCMGLDRGQRLIFFQDKKKYAKMTQVLKKPKQFRIRVIDSIRFNKIN